jgi:hypothetical protein
MITLLWFSFVAGLRRKAGTFQAAINGGSSPHESLTLFIISATIVPFLFLHRLGFE